MLENIVEIFFETAKKYPQNVALCHKSSQITYDSLGEKVQNTAYWLTSKGITSDTKVMVFIPMSIELYQTVLALLSIGSKVVFVDEWSNLERLKDALKVVPVDAIILQRKHVLLSYIISPFRDIRLKLSIPSSLKRSDYAFQKLHPDTTALITFTTGSTGLPKATNRTHHFLNEQFRILKTEIGTNSGDKCLSTLPIVLLCILGTGATGYMSSFNQKKPYKLNVSKEANYLMGHGITHIISSPFYTLSLANSKQIFGVVKKVITGGAPVFPATAQQIIHAFPNAKNMVAYGSTEAEPISVVDMDDLVNVFFSDNKGLFVGSPHTEIQIKIIKITKSTIKIENGNWSEFSLLNEEIGEIVVAGAHVLKSYINSEEAFSLNKIIDGETIWHRTGDSGYLSKGNLFLTGRCTQLIEWNETLISPFVIENILLTIEGISIGTIICKHQQLQIIIEKKPSFKIDMVKNDILNKIKFNVDIIFIDKMPRDPRHYSKIEYSKL